MQCQLAYLRTGVKMKRHKKQSRVRERTTFAVRAKPGVRHQGFVSTRDRTLRCAIGPAGICTTKSEGDGGTPAGRWKFLNVLYRADRVTRPITRLPVYPICKSDGWCDAPEDPNYNRLVTLPYPASAERLHRDDDIYDVVVILNHNTRPRVRGRGSAIFMHHARDGLPPTQGCIALLPLDLHLILRGCGPGSTLEILS